MKGKESGNQEFALAIPWCNLLSLSRSQLPQKYYWWFFQTIPGESTWQADHLHGHAQDWQPSAQPRWSPCVAAPIPPETSQPLLTQA